jgi:hypothetical protein
VSASLDWLTALYEVLEIVVAPDRWAGAPATVFRSTAAAHSFFGLIRALSKPPDKPHSILFYSSNMSLRAFRVCPAEQKT